VPSPYYSATLLKVFGSLILATNRLINAPDDTSPLYRSNPKRRKVETTLPTEIFWKIFSGDRRIHPVWIALIEF